MSIYQLLTNIFLDSPLYAGYTQMALVANSLLNIHLWSGELTSRCSTTM